MIKRKKPTMKDVARLAGVSTSTVSSAVRNGIGVSPARMKRIREAMAALDYRVDAIARGLKTGRTNVIGVVVPDITTAFYPEVIRGIEDAACKSGYGVILCDSNEDPANESNHLDMLLSRRVDGVLLSCCRNSTAYAATVRSHFPVVFVDRVPSTPTERTVSSDNIQAGYLATRHLIEIGHSQIAFVAGHLELSPHHDRLEGFRKAMQEFRLPVGSAYLINGNVQVEDGLNASRQLLTLPNAPTAIMAGNNKLLLGVLQGLEERNIFIPKQMSVIGFDDYLWNKYFNPSLTAVAQSTYEIGRRSFELLLQAIKGEKSTSPSDGHIRLPTELKIRNSTSAPFGTD